MTQYTILSVVPIVDFFNQAHDNGHGSEVLTNCILPPLKASRVEILVVKYLPIKPVVRLCLSIVAYLLDIYSWRGGSSCDLSPSRKQINVKLRMPIYAQIMSCLKCWWNICSINNLLFLNTDLLSIFDVSRVLWCNILFVSLYKYLQG